MTFLEDRLIGADRVIYQNARRWEVAAYSSGWLRLVAPSLWPLSASGWGRTEQRHLGAYGPSVSESETLRLRRRFDRLVDQWLPSARTMSNVMAVVTSVPYQEMLAMGPKALPMVLQGLERGDTPYWLWALRMLAGEDHAAGTVTMDEARDAWLRWGRHEGYIR